MYDTGSDKPIKDRRTLFNLLAMEVGDYLPKPELDEAKVRSIVDECVATATRRIEVTCEGLAPVVIDGAHAQFDEILQLIKEGHQNILMVGPAGCGKTTLGKHLAKGLSLEFGFISLSGGVTESHLLGRTMPQADGSWKFEASRFVKLYTGGGVFLLDEIDAADANVMVSVNAALANGVLALPNGEIVTRHEHCFIIAAANTFGRGANAMYVGRNALDAATLDRFVLATVLVEYDLCLERRIAKELAGDKAGDLLAWVGFVRSGIEAGRLRRVASTRLVESGARALRAGSTMEQVAARYFREWTADEKAKFPADCLNGGVAK